MIVTTSRGGDGFDQSGKIPQIGKQHRNRFELAFQRYAAGEDFVTHLSGYIFSEGIVEKITLPSLASLPIHHPAGKQGHEVEPGYLKPDECC